MLDLISNFLSGKNVPFDDRICAYFARFSIFKVLFEIICNKTNLGLILHHAERIG